MITFPTSRRQIKCMRSRSPRGREQEQPKQVRPSGEKLLILQALLNLKMFESCMYQANLTEAEDIGCNCQNCRSYSFVLSELMGGTNAQNPPCLFCSQCKCGCQRVQA